MSMEITGKLIQKMPQQTGQGRNGTWVKQDFIIETEEQYPKKICVSAWGDSVGAMENLPYGTSVKCSIRIESKEYNGRWYTDIRPWKVEVLRMAEQAPLHTYQPQPPAPQGGDALSNLHGGDSDLPF